ncbi:MAG TPA: aldehyde dehydrogenase family protein [Planctomycetota bacterium]|nr:aldehyde dehydrogenase family protein [Planctomycetota bacterium]
MKPVSDEMPINQSDLDTTLVRARAAQVAWAAKPLRERLRPIAALRARLARDPAGLGNVVAKEIGKSRFEAIGSEILPTADVCAFLMARAQKILAPRKEKMKGTMPFAGNAIVRHIPWGVVALLVPWNYPLFLCAGSVLNALAAGNAVVMKPSPRAKDTVGAFAQWLYDAGVPRELAPVLDSSDEMGRALVASPLIHRIVFTGSSKTGRSVLAAAAQNLVPATMELSGYDAVHILPDADITLAVAAVTFGMKLNGGRTCVCPRRIFVDRSVDAVFTSALSKKIEKLELLTPMDPQTLREADELAARLLAGGAESLNARKQGDARTLLVFRGGSDALAAAQGNFVPAIVVSPVENQDAALKLDAASRYALGASIFTRSLDSALNLADNLPSGMIAINECVTPAGEAALPFGGAHESGFGVRSGIEGLLEMTRPQTLGIASGSFRPHHLAGEEASDLLLALLRARHAPNVFARMKGWLDYGMESVKWLRKIRLK